MPPPEITLRARLIFPVAGPPLQSGCLRYSGDRITAVGPCDRTPDLDLGTAAIVPGFVNAHTHLELSGLRAKDLASSDFCGWLRKVITWRRDQSAASSQHAVQRGIDASLAAGTTLLADISSGGRSWIELLRSPMRATIYCELLGLRDHRATETTRAARQFLEWTTATQHPASSTDPDHPNDSNMQPLPHAAAILPNQRLTPSLSPHAPYSTRTALYDLAADWARRAATPITTHLAETPEEIRFLARGDGPLRSFLESIDAWENNLEPLLPHPLDYVDSTGPRDAHWIIAHGNYLTDQDITRLAAENSTGTRRAVAYCPRTHAYFGHPTHPYRKMLDAGLTVCLGTDSLASTPNLSLLDEMRFLWRRDPTLPCDSLLRMATLNGAEALGRTASCGSLTPGKLADFAIVRLPDRDEPDPYRLLLDSTEPVVRTIIGGRTAYEQRPFAHAKAHGEPK